ncbi:hypothetical protein BDZ89DRAFT_1166980 [Hymenopellis radicata]|nr:hypothetical protein BDZ89DRAFT_1166980 [Hymenopellis radicata]
MDQSPPTPLGASSAPVEILQHIFTLDAESYGGFCFRPVLSTLRFDLPMFRVHGAPLLLAQASSGRARGQHQSKFQDGLCQRKRMAVAFSAGPVSRTRPRFPLHILLACSGMPRWRTDEEIQAIVAALLHTAPRWKSLSLWLRVDSDEEDGDWSFLDPLHDRLDSLEKLHVIVSGHDIPSLALPPSRSVA